MEGITQLHRLLSGSRLLFGWVLLCLALGCQSADEDSGGDVKTTSGQQLVNGQANGDSSAPAGQQSPAPAAQPRREVPREYTPGPGPAPTEPYVVFTSGMQLLNPVGVGDTAPAFTLPTYAGEQAALADLMGQKLTLLIFWKSDEPFCVEEVARLERDVLAKYSSVGLEVVTVHVGEQTPAMQAIITAISPRFNVLVDAQESAVRQYAMDLYPRTYLLDAQGKILWFDNEYSRSTKREMDNAIRYYLLDSQ